MQKVIIRFVPGLFAACVGGVLGHFVTDWLLKQNRDAPVFPGAFAGLACGFCSVDSSRIRGLLCALIALAAGLISYWILWKPPFDTDGSLFDLVIKSYHLHPVTQIMLVLGTFLGFWWGRETTSPWRHRLTKPTEEP